MKSRLCFARLPLLPWCRRLLRAADEAPALKCPVSGGPAKATDRRFQRRQVQFCCESAGGVCQDPSKFAAKANLQLAQTKQLKASRCPLTGKPCNPESR